MIVFLSLNECPQIVATVELEFQQLAVDRQLEKTRLFIIFYPNDAVRRTTKFRSMWRAGSRQHHVPTRRLNNLETIKWTTQGELQWIPLSRFLVPAQHTDQGSHDRCVIFADQKWRSSSSGYAKRGAITRSSNDGRGQFLIHLAALYAKGV